MGDAGVEGEASGCFALSPLGEMTGAVAEKGLACPGVRPAGAALFGWLELVGAWGPGLAKVAAQREHPDLALGWTPKVERGGKRWRSPAFPTPGRVPVVTPLLGGRSGVNKWFFFTSGLVTF